MPAIKAFVLAKNEAPNIERCLRSLQSFGIEVVVLDSGSTDGTPEKCTAFPFVRLEPYVYRNHLAAYTEICCERTRHDEFAIILDADMAIPDELREEIIRLVDLPQTQVIECPITMYCAERPMRFGSLCPAKPIVFRGSKSYFVAVGHGEKIPPTVPVVATRNYLLHDDRKGYDNFLLSQYRYAQDLVRRSKQSRQNWRDRLRVSTPMMMLITPLYSLVVRLGVLSGKIGLIYALDRLIWEAVAFRLALADRVRSEETQREADKAIVRSEESRSNV